MLEVLPVDHYHAATDPLVIVLAGILVGRLVGRLVGAGRGVAAPPGESSPARVSDPAGPRGRAVLAGLAVATLGLWNLATQPPAVSPDGGWPAMKEAARRVAASLPRGSLALARSLPAFVAPDAVTFALHAVGQPAVGPEEASGDEPGGPSLDEPPEPAPGHALVVLCDERFRAGLGPPCGGPAEGAWLGSVAWTLVDRFPVAGGRYVSVYLPTHDSARQP
ncbi:MAG: hypothetical protein KatS3mg065_0848 [Chloroflexota bacterium]|nr:MAG: hypothetical protein KatS3mg065_0848 [Chloroflexota bacterium]